MGHRKKKVKKEEFKQAKMEATRQWLITASQYPIVRFYAHAQSVKKDRICFDKILLEMNSTYAYDPLDYGFEEHLWVNKNEYLKSDDIHPEDLNKSICAEDYSDFMTPYGVNWWVLDEQTECIDIEDIKEGDYVGFDATIQPYQRANGTMDFGVTQIRYIRRIDKEDYDIPSDEDLIAQEIRKLICETCMFYDHCDIPLMYCMRNKEDWNERFEYLKNFEPDQFTPYTVLAAYEKEGYLVSDSINFENRIQTEGLRELLAGYPMQYQKMILDSIIHPPITRFSEPMESIIAAMTFPPKPRRYIEKQTAADDLTIQFIKNAYIKCTVTNINESGEIFGTEIYCSSNEHPFIDNLFLSKEGIWFDGLEDHISKIAIGDQIVFMRDVFINLKHNQNIIYDFHETEDRMMLRLRNEELIDLNIMEDANIQEKCFFLQDGETIIDIVDESSVNEIINTKSEQIRFKIFGVIHNISNKQIVLDDAILLIEDNMENNELNRFLKFEKIEFKVEKNTIKNINIKKFNLIAFNCALNRNSTDFANVRMLKENKKTILAIIVDNAQQIVCNAEPNLNYLQTNIE